jgi:hypothetical protein
MMNDFLLALFKIFATSIISVMKVDWFLAIISPLPIRAKIASTIHSLHSFAGTNNPQCAIKTIIAFCLKYVDLPHIFGQVMICRNHSSLSDFPFNHKSFGINC